MYRRSKILIFLRLKSFSLFIFFLIPLKVSANTGICHVDDLLSLRQKQVTDLDLEAQRVRAELIDAGSDGPSVTGLRSEFKHQTPASDNVELIGRLQRQFPEGVDAQGTKIGMRYRDKPRADGKRGYTDTGSSEKFSYRTKLANEAIDEVAARSSTASKKPAFIDSTRDADLYEKLKQTQDDVMASYKQRNPSATPEQL
jgi:hypothetical protein